MLMDFKAVLPRSASAWTIFRSVAKAEIMAFVVDRPGYPNFKLTYIFLPETPAAEMLLEIKSRSQDVMVENILASFAGTGAATNVTKCMEIDFTQDQIRAQTIRKRIAARSGLPTDKFIPCHRLVSQLTLSKPIDVGAIIRESGLLTHRLSRHEDGEAQPISNVPVPEAEVAEGGGGEDLGLRKRNTVSFTILNPEALGKPMRLGDLYAPLDNRQ